MDRQQPVRVVQREFERRGIEGQARLVFVSGTTSVQCHQGSRVNFYSHMRDMLQMTCCAPTRVFWIAVGVDIDV